VVLFGTGFEDGAKAKVVRSFSGGLPHLIWIVRGDPDQLVRAHHLSRQVERQVFLPQMDAIGVHGQGQVAAIVDDEEDARLRSSFSEQQGFHIGVLHGRALVAILEENNTGLSRSPQYFD